MGARTWTLAVLLLLQIVAGMGNDDPALRDARTPALDPHVADGPETPRESPVAEEGTVGAARRCTPENASRCPAVSLEGVVNASLERFLCGGSVECGEHACGLSGNELGIEHRG